LDAQDSSREKISVFKAKRAFTVAVVLSACAVYANPASATTTIEALPDTTGSFLNCPWGYASATQSGLVAHGETVVAPSETDTVLDTFSFYVTQLRESDGQFVGDPRTITYKAYVGKWDGQTVTETVWQSAPQTLTTSADPAQWKTTVETGGVQFEPGQQYALFFSTHETNEFNALEDRGCGIDAIGNGYAAGASLIRYLGEPDTNWRLGLFSADVAFEASFSSIYDFDGFYAPVNNKDAQGNYILNAVKAGSAIPVKFSLGGDYGLDVFEADYPKSQAIECTSSADVDGIEETVNAGGSSLSYAAGSDTYNYVWKTDKAWADSCRQLVVKFDDGTTARANFKFH
jgi:hypothetical protein